MAGEGSRFGDGVALQVGERDQAAVRSHFVGQKVRGFAFVELLGAAARDALERACQLWLDQQIARLIKLAAVLKHPARFRISRQVPGVAELLRAQPGQRVPLSRKPDRRLQQLGPRPCAELSMRQFEATHVSRHSRSPPPGDAVGTQLAVAS